MSDTETSPLLSLPFIQAAQAQKHVTHNAALELLDMLVQLVVEATDATTPPQGAFEGQAWVIGTGATGTWAGRATQIAAWRGGGWLFVAPLTGWRAWDKTNAAVMIFDGSAWIQTGGGDHVPRMGINATSDTTNRLAVSAPATLLSHEGAGHQVKINKAGPSDTAALLYQTNWSGRAEMGLAGNDDFSIKVSADGSTFTEALRIDAATGVVDMPATGALQILPVNYRCYLYTDKRWTSPSPNSSSINAYADLGTGTEPIVSWDGKGIYLPAGTTIRTFTFAGSVSSAEVADVDLRLYFQYGSWNAGWVNGATTSRIALYSQNSAGLIGATGMRRTVFTLEYTTPADGYFVPVMRADATSTLTGTHYFYLSGALDLTLPPSA